MVPPKNRSNKKKSSNWPNKELWRRKRLKKPQLTISSKTSKRRSDNNSFRLRS